MANFNKYENVCLHACASVTGVSIVDILGSKKNKEIVMARALTCSVLSYCGFGLREISRLTNTDVKGVSTYIESHDNKMSEKRYSRSYQKSVDFISDYEETSDESLQNKVNVLFEKYMTMQGQYEHLKELLTSN